MCKPVSVTPTALFESLRALRVAEPNLGVKPLIAQLQKQQPDLGACTKEVQSLSYCAPSASLISRGQES